MEIDTKANAEAAKRYEEQLKETRGKYNHTEAFCLMLYKCGKCGFIEILYNSRDGVTPFMIDCRNCKETAQHINWGNDTRLPDFKPYVGMRIFVTISKEEYHLYNVKKAEKCWSDPKYKDFIKYYKSQDDLAKSLDKEYKEGQPFVKEIKCTSENYGY